MGTIVKIKDVLWNAASNGKRDEFDKAVDNLCDAIRGEWWRIGWELAPKSADDLVKFLDSAAAHAHSGWREAVERGDCPDEDISPAEGFSLCSRVIREAIHPDLSDGKAMPLLVPEEKMMSIINNHNLLNADLGACEASFPALAEYFDHLSSDDRRLDTDSIYNHFDNDLKVVGRKMFDMDEVDGNGKGHK